MSRKVNNPTVSFANSSSRNFKENRNCLVADVPSFLKKLAIWDSLNKIFAIHRGYVHHPLHFDEAALPLKTLSLSVFIALGTLGTAQVVHAFPSESAFIYNETTKSWSLRKDSKFVVTIGNSYTSPVYRNITKTDKVKPASDPFDNSQAWIWSFTKDSEDSKEFPGVLKLSITEDQDWNKYSGKYKDHTSATMWISGGLKSDFYVDSAVISKISEDIIDPLVPLDPDVSKDVLKKKYYIGTLTAAPANEGYSQTTNGNQLFVELGENTTFMGKFFGSRNDIGGGVGSTSTFLTVGDTNNNVVDITLNKKSKLYAKLIFGGRSAQLDAVKGSEVEIKDKDGNTIATTNAIHKGFQTNNNKIKINGNLTGHLQAKDFNEKEQLDSALLITKGVFGAEGYESNNNLVSVKNTLVSAGSTNARKLGLVGGRGLYYLRINQIQLGSVTNNSLVWDGDKLADHSAVANNNIVTVDNSYIGFKLADTDNHWITSEWGDSNPQAFSIYGGWATGQAENNIVSIKNSVVNGNVIGGLELQDRIYASKTDLRKLSPNLVSLFNVKVAAGSAVYGTSTAEGEISHKASDNGVMRVDESTLKAVNRRRGVVYLAGENEADSIYARYVHFGQYVDNEVLETNPETDRNINRDYYPTSGNYQSVIENPNYVVSDSKGLKRITSENDEANQFRMQLGDLVAKTYIVNRTGFHSSLTSRDTANVSTVTNGLHNFWVGAYVNLVKCVDGDGAIFKKEGRDLFKDKSNFIVNHTYGDGDNSQGQNLSLLVHDDGMIYDFDREVKDKNETAQEHQPSLMHNFRYHYDGLVLYTGVNTGKNGNEDIHAVEISFSEIEKFRNNSKQNLNAFGNTFVGVFMEGNAHPFFKPSSENGFNSISFNEMTFEPETEAGLPPFEIWQRGEVVANATYGFYKYLHFDGHEGTFLDKDPEGNKDSDGNVINVTVNGKLTTAGTSGGVGLAYWLKSLNIIDGKTLLLNGALEKTDLGSTPNIRLQERLTLSAALKGNGNVAIAENSAVVLGSPKTIYTISSPNQKGEVFYKKPEANEYTGATYVQQGATLAAGIDGALGSTNKFTSSLKLQDNAAFYLQNHTQDVGHLYVAENAKLDLSNPADISNTTANFKYEPDMGDLGVLVVHNTYKPNGENLASDILGNIEGAEDSRLVIDTGRANISSANENFLGTFELRRAKGYLYNSNAIQKAKAIVSQGSSLYFHNAEELERTRASDPRSNAFVSAIQNAGQVFLSGGKEEVAALNHIKVENGYEGQSGSVIHYRGLVQGPDNSYVDVVHSATATGTSTVSFGEDHNKIPVSGIFAEARGEKTLKRVGIPVFVISNRNGGEGEPLELEMKPFGVVAKGDEAYKWIYHLGYNDDENGGRTWVLYNSDDEDHYEPVNPPNEDPKDPPKDDDKDDGKGENLVLRPEAGAYLGASQSWAKMHMRLHDRFGQAYYIDPFDGEEKPAAAWVRQVGSHSHFRMGGGQSKTHSNTAVTQIGGDLLRNEFNEDWKYIGGVFAGGLYNRSDSRSWDSAKSRSDGYSLGIYGTLYTGNSPDDGFYVDSWLLFGRYDNKIWSDEISSFKFKSHGWVWSVETGYTIPLGESGTKDYNKLIWTFQPEAQLVWDGVKANSAKDPTGTKYRQLGTDNVTLRVGARLHANYMNKGLGFIEGNWIHNTKKAGVQMGTDKVYMDGGRNLGEFRMGLEGHLSRNTLGWATVGVQAGKSGYHNETAQIGIKYMF